MNALSGSKIVIRADTRARSGSGHASRCLALADALSASGASVVFVTEEEDSPGNRLLDGASANRVPLVAGTVDAQATREIAADASWLVVDHYGLDAAWEERAAIGNCRLLAIDDLADRPHACNIVADAGRGTHAGKDYSKLVSADCTVLAGPRFALLRPGFRRPVVERHRNGQINILVYFGSVDRGGLTARTVAAIGRTGLVRRAIVHVLGSGAKAGITHPPPGGPVIAHGHVSDMSAMLDRIDIAAGAGGVSLWERCSRNVPSVTVALNDNQAPGVEIAAAAGATRAIGGENASEETALAEALEQLADEPEQCAAMGAAGRRLVDGRGAQRVAAMMGPVEIRVAGAGDCERLWDWANDPSVRAAAFNGEPIPLDTHRVWFEQKLCDAGVLMLIAEIDGVAVGQVRFDSDPNGKDWEIDISIAPTFRNRRLSTEILLKAITELGKKRQNAAPLAWVKRENVRSRKLFESAGFIGAGERNDALRYRYA